jgi:ribosomal protein L37AE/L43A
VSIEERTARLAGPGAEDKTVVYQCEGCDETFEKPPAPLWECSSDNCGEVFVSDDRACPACSGTFSHKLAPWACESCQDEVDEVEEPSA